MTPDEFARWKAVTENSRFRWTEDEIFRLNGRGPFYYTGGEDGVYMKIGRDGKLEGGTYEGTIPHIGEASFKPAVTRQYTDFNEAFAAAMEAGGKKFLMDMFGGADIPRREEKPSVLEQIRAAKPAPKEAKEQPPRQKSKGGPER